MTNLYLRRKKDNGKLYYTIETKIRIKDKQTGVHLATLPPLNKVLEWISGEVSEDYIRNKVEKKLKVSASKECLPNQSNKEQEKDNQVRLITIGRTDTFDEPSEEDIEKSLAEIKD
jgi:hypothetical protein